MTNQTQKKELYDLEGLCCGCGSERGYPHTKHCTTDQTQVKQPYTVQGKTLEQWLKILGWQGGTIHQVEREISDEFYILRKLRMIEGLNAWDKLRINDHEAVLICIQNRHELPEQGKKVIHARQKGLGDSFIGKDELSYFIGLIN